MAKNLLVDTHILLWALTNHPRLSANARTLLTRADRVVVSAASLWEISIKAQLGKLTVPERFGVPALAERGYTFLSITPDHALQIRAIEPHHSDPFDRMLVVQARHEGLTLISHDEAFRAYDVDVVLV